jgi:hypothetical protein
MPAPAVGSLSKSKVMAGMQCLKRLYFQVHSPEIATTKKDEGQYARLEEGREVGMLAQRVFPGGRAISFDHGIGGALAETAALLEDTTVSAIYEATFQHSNVLVRVDILERVGATRWRLIEVKSSVQPKQHHLQDLAIQRHVVAESGVDVASAWLMHLDREYRYDGRNHDVGALFKMEDATVEINKICTSLPALLNEQRESLAMGTAPDVAPGPQCSDPYVCEFFGNCNPEPPPHHISLLPRLSEKKRQQLTEQGFTLIHEIPEDFPLTETQARVRSSVQTGKTWVSETLDQELAVLRWPRYFMDFESLYPAIPRFAQMWPYSQIPFQWSVHRQMTPDAELEHFEFLAGDERDPRREFIESLCAVLGTEGPIVVYNASFESQRLRELAGWMSEYGDPIDRIRGRLWDLLRIVQAHLYHPAFNGSFSIKSVLPALMPEMTYGGMEVANGVAAGLAWERIVRGDLDVAEKERLKAALLAYCCQDTLAMVKLLESLNALVAKSERSSA